MSDIKELEYLIENIETEQGGLIIDTLRKNTWKLVSQYSIFAFDKGIDYDDCRLKKGGDELYFEWSNWFQWRVVGSKKSLEKLVFDFSLEQEIIKAPEPSES